jgi:excisionase family DNA binding protein
MESLEDLLLELATQKFTPDVPKQGYRIRLSKDILPSEVVISPSCIDGCGKSRKTTKSDRKKEAEGNPRLLSAKSAAAFLGLHVQTVYDMAASGRLPSLKIGKSRKFDINALNEWIERKKEERHD